LCVRLKEEVLVKGISYHGYLSLSKYY